MIIDDDNYYYFKEILFETNIYKNCPFVVVESCLKLLKCLLRFIYFKRLN